MLQVHWTEPSGLPDFYVTTTAQHVEKTRTVIRIATAWESIGWDEGLFRIKGGHAVYEVVVYNCHNEGRLVKLAKLKPEESGIREVKRYVDPDTVLEFLSD